MLLHMPDANSQHEGKPLMPATSRLGYGQLEPLLFTHLRTYPHLDFSPWELAQVLGHSHGTIRRILTRLAAAGTVIQTRMRPARFQISP